MSTTRYNPKDSLDNFFNEKEMVWMYRGGILAGAGISGIFIGGLFMIAGIIFLVLSIAIGVLAQRPWLRRQLNPWAKTPPVS